MTPEELEQLALQLATLSEAQRNDVVWRAREMVHAKRTVGHRLAGTAPSRWGDLVAGGLIYNADGQALCRVQHIDVRRETSHNMNQKTITRVYITAYREDQ